MKIIDLTYTIDETCMTCGVPWHEKVKINQLGTIESVGRNTHSITLGSHTGTHIDAPLHFLKHGSGIDTIDLEDVCGRCKIIDMSHKKMGDVVELEDVTKIDISKRMMFRFDWFRKWKDSGFYDGFPYFSVEAVSYLVENGMKVIALDTPSPDSGNAIGADEDSPVHKFLLKNGIVIIEYLTNTDLIVDNKDYNMIALPLKIKDCDGAPARVIMIEEE